MEERKGESLIKGIDVGEIGVTEGRKESYINEERKANEKEKRKVGWVGRREEERNEGTSVRRRGRRKVESLIKGKGGGM